MTTPSSAECLQRLLHTQRDVQRWERKHTTLQQQLTLLTQRQPTTPSPTTPPQPTSTPSPKRRLVTLNGVERTIASHSTVPPSASPSRLPSPPPPPPIPSAILQRDRRLIAGLRSHLTSASSLPPSHLPSPPTTSPSTSLQLALARCATLLTQLQRKERCGVWQWMQRVREEAEALKAGWFWTREGEGNEGDGEEGEKGEGARVSIAWRVREMSETWRVVMEEEAKQRMQARLRRQAKKVGSGGDDEPPALPFAGGGKEGEWTEEDERRLQEMLEEERRRELQPQPEVRRDVGSLRRGGRDRGGGFPSRRTGEPRGNGRAEMDHSSRGKRRREEEEPSEAKATAAPTAEEAKDRGGAAVRPLEDSEEDREVERLLNADG